MRGEARAIRVRTAIAIEIVNHLPVRLEARPATLVYDPRATEPMPERILIRAVAAREQSQRDAVILMPDRAGHSSVHEMIWMRPTPADHVRSTSLSLSEKCDSTDAVHDCV